MYYRFSVGLTIMHLPNSTTNTSQGADSSHPIKQGHEKRKGKKQKSIRRRNVSINQSAINK